MAETPQDSLLGGLVTQRTDMTTPLSVFETPHSDLIAAAKSAFLQDPSYAAEVAVRARKRKAREETSSSE